MLGQDQLEDRKRNRSSMQRRTCPCLPSTMSLDYLIKAQVFFTVVVVMQDGVCRQGPLVLVFWTHLLSSLTKPSLNNREEGLWFVLYKLQYIPVDKPSCWIGSFDQELRWPEQAWPQHPSHLFFEQRCSKKENRPSFTDGAIMGCNYLRSSRWQLVDNVAFGTIKLLSPAKILAFGEGHNHESPPSFLPNVRASSISTR